MISLSLGLGTSLASVVGLLGAFVSQKLNS